MNGVSEANVVKRKVSKKALKILAHPYMDGKACVCLSVCLEPKVKINKITGA
jgi:hypothetical protein